MYGMLVCFAVLLLCCGVSLCYCLCVIIDDVVYWVSVVVSCIVMLLCYVCCCSFVLLLFSCVM